MAFQMIQNNTRNERINLVCFKLFGMICIYHTVSFGLAVGTILTKFFFRPWGHAASFWAKTAAVAKFLHQNSHYEKIMTP